jgi:hypothetical protein
MSRKLHRRSGFACSYSSIFLLLCSAFGAALDLTVSDARSAAGGLQVRKAGRRCVVETSPPPLSRRIEADRQADRQVGSSGGLHHGTSPRHGTSVTARLLQRASPQIAQSMLVGQVKTMNTNFQDSASVETMPGSRELAAFVHKFRVCFGGVVSGWAAMRRRMQLSGPLDSSRMQREDGGIGDGFTRASIIREALAPPGLIVRQPQMTRGGLATQLRGVYIHRRSLDWIPPG